MPAKRYTVILSPAQRARAAFARHGFDAGLETQPMDHPRRARKLDGAGEARLVRLACAAPPAGHADWTLQLLADQLVTLQVVDTVGTETVRRTRKKMT